MDENMYEIFIDAAAVVGWNACSECSTWMPQENLVERDGWFFCHTCADAYDAAVTAVYPLNFGISENYIYSASDLLVDAITDLGWLKQRHIFSPHFHPTL